MQQDYIKSETKNNFKYKGMPPVMFKKYCVL